MDRGSRAGTPLRTEKWRLSRILMFGSRGARARVSAIDSRTLTRGFAAMPNCSWRSVHACGHG